MSSKSLGRGIEAIIGSKIEGQLKKRNDPGVSYVKVSQIKPNPNQPRRNFDTKALDELSNSIIEIRLFKNMAILCNSTSIKIKFYYKTPKPQRYEIFMI